MLTSGQIYIKIEKELQKRGVSQHKMLVESGLSKNALDKMKKGSMPSADKIAAIADYLGVSIDLLLGRTEQPEKENASESDIRSVIVQKVNGLSDHQADILLAFLEGLQAK